MKKIIFIQFLLIFTLMILPLLCFSQKSSGVFLGTPEQDDNRCGYNSKGGKKSYYYELSNFENKKVKVYIKRTATFCDTDNVSTIEKTYIVNPKSSRKIYDCPKADCAGKGFETRALSIIRWEYSK